MLPSPPPPAPPCGDPRILAHCLPGERVVAYRSFRRVDAITDAERHGVVLHDPATDVWRGALLSGYTQTSTLRADVVYAGPDADGARRAVNVKLGEAVRAGYGAHGPQRTTLVIAHPELRLDPGAAPQLVLHAPPRLSASQLVVGDDVGYIAGVVRNCDPIDLCTHYFEYSADGDEWGTVLGTSSQVRIAARWAGWWLRVRLEVQDFSTREILLSAVSAAQMVAPACSMPSRLTGTRQLNTMPHCTPAVWVGDDYQEEGWMVGPTPTGPWTDIDDPTHLDVSRLGAYLCHISWAGNAGGRIVSRSEPYGPLMLPAHRRVATSIREGLYGGR